MTTVHQAIGGVIAELGGVGKEQRNKEQSYNFRGIDDVLKALHPLLGKHGVFICPDVIEREYEERVSAKGTVGHCAHLHVRFTVYGPDGDSVQLSTWGEGLDYGDKATNKAMTAAFKYALFELFAVSDPFDDGDAETPEASKTTSRRERVGTTRPSPRRDVDPETGEIAGEPQGREQASDGAQAVASPANVESMKPRDLNAALARAGLPTGGTVPQMRERLAAHVDGAASNGAVAVAERTTEPGQCTLTPGCTMPDGHEEPCF